MSKSVGPRGPEPRRRPKEKNGRCCSCGYEGEEQTPCEARDDETHCVHWWEGPDDETDCLPWFDGPDR